MASDDPLGWRRLARTLGVGVLVVLGVALAARALPVPVSPFLLGALAAAVYWLLRPSRIGD